MKTYLEDIVERVGQILLSGVAVLVITTFFWMLLWWVWRGLASLAG